MEENIVCGRNAVIELIKSGNPVNKILLKNEKNQNRNNDLLHALKEKGIPFQFVDGTVLDKYSGGEKHQGIVALTACKEYVEPEDILAISYNKGEDPFILVLDEIEDPHNLGALLRTADAARGSWRYYSEKKERRTYTCSGTDFSWSGRICTGCQSE
jgi:23S rRNA (guanosine2251-2'-O)-methyltransferase